jgi:hypothetical protein
VWSKILFMYTTDSWELGNVEGFNKSWTELLWSEIQYNKRVLYELSHKTMGIHNWTQTGNGTHIRTICQKNKVSVSIKQRPIKMDGRTIHKTLSPKGHLFKLGLTDDPTCERCLEEDESATHILYDCETIGYLRFRHLGQFFMEPSDYYDDPINKDLHFIRNVGLI